MRGSIFVLIRNSDRKIFRPVTRIKGGRLSNKAGFSLLELVLVFIIISVLTVVLLSKINRLQSDVYEASVQLTANSLQAVVRLTHSVWQYKGSSNKTELLQGFGSGNILMGQHGWPIDVIEMNQHSAVIISEDFALSNSTCIRLWNGLLKGSAPKVRLKVESDDMAESNIESLYIAQLEGGICQYRYHLYQDGLRIHYDLATGRVITLF
ncbi:MAG: type II secretory pathway pseudopilin PulG [Kiritimatiellia bacterium]|jgi:type II secretory pathway pseudopilin PulG